MKKVLIILLAVFCVLQITACDKKEVSSSEIQKPTEMKTEHLSTGDNSAGELTETTTEEVVEKGTFENPYQFGEVVTLDCVSNYYLALEGMDHTDNILPEKVVIEIAPIDFSLAKVNYNIKLVEGKNIELNCIGFSVATENREEIARGYNAIYSDDYRILSLFEGGSGSGYMDLYGIESIDDKPRYFGITYYRYDSKYKNVNEVLEDEMEFIWFEVPEEQYDLTTKEDVLGYDSEVIWSEYGAESPDEAFQLFWQALETEDEALAKRISGAYYVAYVLSGRECLSEPSIGAYLEVESASDFWGRKDYSLLKEGYNISEEGGMSASWLEYNENSVNSRFGTNASIMAGYQYLYYDLDGAPDEAINLYQIDGRWFVSCCDPDMSLGWLFGMGN